MNSSFVAKSPPAWLLLFHCPSISLLISLLPAPCASLEPHSLFLSTFWPGTAVVVKRKKVPSPLAKMVDHYFAKG
jgi:hypothetical protein